MSRLHLPFEVVAPEVDETPLPDESPDVLARRLALAKAQAVARLHPQAVVIGSDQVADLAGDPLGKPGTHERAVQQLQRMRGQTVVFQTAVAVVCLATGYEARVDLVLEGGIVAHRLRVTVLPELRSPLLGMDVLGRLQFSQQDGRLTFQGPSR